MRQAASGTGIAPTVAARVALPVSRRVLLLEGSFAYASLDERISPPATRVAFAEAQLQAQMPSGRVGSYFGVGGGWLRYLNNAYARKTTAPTLSAAAGVRAAVSARMGVRGSGQSRYRSARVAGSSARPLACGFA
jgi:hypothetical protein